jgi:hypothetical protein
MNQTLLKPGDEQTIRQILESHLLRTLHAEDAGNNVDEVNAKYGWYFSKTQQLEAHLLQLEPNVDHGPT